MYGLILACFESLILNKYGLEKWKKIQEISNHSSTLPTGQFIHNIHYSDELTYTFLHNASIVCETSSEQLMERLGEHFCNYIREIGYESTFLAQGETFLQFLENVNEPHRLLRSRFPDACLPEFWCTQFQMNKDETTSCIFHYYSARGLLFAPLVVGLIKEVGRLYYDVICEFEQVSQMMEESYVHTIWGLKFWEAGSPEEKKSESHRRRPLSAALPSPNGGNVGNRVSKCPFSHHCQESRPTTPIVHLSDISTPALLPLEPVQFGLSYRRVAKLFPFHIVVSNHLDIIQYGEKFESFLHLLPLVNQPMSVTEILSFQTPPGLTWSWETILMFADRDIEVSAFREEGNVIFRGNVMLLDPITDPGVTIPCAMILLSPVVYNFEELENLHMHLTDFPTHTFQRELITIGEHIKIERNEALRLDVLSHKLEEEGTKSLNSLKTKRCFVRYVSHEIRTPLSIALLGLRYLNEQLQSHENPQMREVLQEVRDSCIVSVDILNDLLLYEKFDDGLLTLLTKEVKIAEYFLETVGVYRLQANSCGTTYEVKISDELATATVNIDGMKFGQVIRNLISNALKFTPKGGKVIACCEWISGEHKDPHIHFATMSTTMKDQLEAIKNPSPSHGFVRVSIIDSGAGLSKENQLLMFDQFVQFNADRLQNGAGSGLGLWIASNIMHLHGGRIGVSSEGEGKGATFVVDLPISTFKANSTNSNRSIFPVTNTFDISQFQDRLKTLRILVVDDSSLNRKVVRRVLDDKFALIHEAVNGREAVQLYQQSQMNNQPYHLIMMDSQMPVMNGLDATKAIRLLKGSVTIIGVTGNAMKQEIETFQAAGVDAVLPKPLNIDDLFSFICSQVFLM